MTGARMSQILDFNLLAPRIQEASLLAEIEIDGKRAQRLTRWAEQEKRIARNDLRFV